MPVFKGATAMMVAVVATTSIVEHRKMLTFAVP